MDSLGKEWWNAALIETHNLRRPYVFKSAFPAQVDDLSKLAMDVLRKLMTPKGVSGGFRIWVGDENNEISLPPTKEYDEIMCANPPREGEAVTDWSRRVFGDRKFGIILNDGEMYSAEMNKRLALMIRPLLDLIGMPLTGVTTAYFVGNYGYTPIGIHQDHVGEDVFHFHLGPGPKTMYTWEQDFYKEISGVSNNIDPEPLLDRADEYDFDKGDIYFMPWDRYHIGYSSELSVGLTVWINNPTPAAFIRKVARSIIGEITPVRDHNIMKRTVLSPDTGIPGDMKIFEEIAPFVQLDESMADLSLQEFMHVSVENYRLGLLSNSGFTLLQEPDKHSWEVLKDQEVRLVQPFRIYYSVFKSKLFMFIRGYKIEIKYHPELPLLLDALNSGATYSTAELIKPLVAKWPEQVALQVLALVLNHRGIEIPSGVLAEEKDTEVLALGVL